MGRLIFETEEIDNRTHLDALIENHRGPLNEWSGFWGDMLRLAMDKMPKPEPRINIAGSATFQGKVALAIGAAVMAATIIAAGAKTYQKYLSGAARACKGADNKDECKKKFKMKGLQTRIAALQKAKGMCSKSKDEGKCKSKIDSEISKLSKRMKA